MAITFPALSFFDLDAFRHRALFDNSSQVWEALSRLKEYLRSQELTDLPRSLRTGEIVPRTVAVLDGEVVSGPDLRIEFGDTTKGGLQVYAGGNQLENASVIMSGAVINGDRINLGKGVLVQSGAFLNGPLIIDDHTEVRHGAFLRGDCLIGKRCVVGHVTEIKHTIFLDDAKAGHFAYLGDSMLGNRVNLGAGTKLANLKFLRGSVTIRTQEGTVDTRLRKLGAILGDDTQTGCNSVTNPGALLGRSSVVYPNTTVPSGFHQHRSIIR